MASFSNSIWMTQYKKSDNPNKVRTIGYEFEGHLDDMDLQEKLIYPKDDEERKEKEKFMLDLKIAGIGNDGGGIEMVTNPDSASYIRQGGSPRFKKFIKFLSEEMIPDAASGTHIHIGRLPSDVGDMDEMIWAYMSVFGSQAQKIFGRISHWAKAPAQISSRLDKIEEKTIPLEFMKQGFINGNAKPHRGYASKNHIVTFRERTIEFRGPKSSNNLFEILAWTQFCLNIVNLAAINEPNRDSNNRLGVRLGEKRDISFNDLIKGHFISIYTNALSGERKISKHNRNIKISDMETTKVLTSPSTVKAQYFGEEFRNAEEF